jgi:hypothetical protein
MGVQIDQGKELIMAHKDEIDEARAQGKDIPSAEELVAQLEADKQALIDKFATGEFSEADIRQAEEEMRSKWDKVRLDLEKLQEQASAEIYTRIKTELEKRGYDSTKLQAIDPSVGIWQDYLKKLQEKGECLEAGAIQTGGVQFLDTFDDFSNGSIDGQKGWYGFQDENTLEEIQGRKAKGGKAIRFYDNNPSLYREVRIAKRFAASAQGSMEADIMASSESSGTLRFNFLLSYSHGSKPPVMGGDKHLHLYTH